MVSAAETINYKSTIDQPVMNNRWMLIHFATIVKINSTPVSWLVGTSNHVTVVICLTILSDQYSTGASGICETTQTHKLLDQ